MNRNYRDIAVAILVFVLVLLLIKSCKEQQKAKELANKVKYLEGQYNNFKVKVNKDSSTIAQQKQTILSQKQAIELGILKLDGAIKKAESQVNQEQKIVYKEIQASYVPDGYADTTGWYFKFKDGVKSKDVLDSVLANSIIVPKRFQYEAKWLKVDGIVKKDNVQFDSIEVNNESSVTIGWKNKGFLGLSKEPVVEVKNTNPYLKVEKMNNFVLEKKKGLFEKKIFWLGVGVAGGFLIFKK